MGSRHNRKRTRSRPRNRKNTFSVGANGHGGLTYSSPPFSPTYSPFSPTHTDPPPLPQTLYKIDAALPSPNTLHIRQAQARTQRLLLLSQQQQYQRHEAAMEDERMRMFGGEKGDPISLCAPMLRVVMDLFGGNVDYVDP